MKKPIDPYACLPSGVSPAAEESSDAGPVDTLNREGAMVLARRLQQYWHEEGYPAARFWAEPIDDRFAKVGTC